MVSRPRVQKNPFFLKSPTFWVFEFWALLGFSDFLFKQAVGKLVG